VSLCRHICADPTRACRENGAEETMGFDLAELEIRPMIESDLDAVVAMEVACFPDAWSRESFESEVNDPQIHWPLVAFHRNELIGYLVVWYVLDEAHIANICISPPYRRKGLATQLFTAALAEARRRGTRRFDLEVRVSNEQARKLYENLGFAPLGIRRRYYADNREDALLMCLRFDKPSGESGGGESDCPG
jgi:[ribosomal protein S18]-alanine N-acetyltransferase